MTAQVDLRSSLHIALAEARRARSRAGGDAGKHVVKFDSLISKLESVLKGLDRGSPEPLELITKSVIDWIPDIDDPLVHALDQVEVAAGTT